MKLSGSARYKSVVKESTTPSAKWLNSACGDKLRKGNTTSDKGRRTFASTLLAGVTTSPHRVDDAQAVAGSGAVISGIETITSVTKSAALRETVRWAA